MVTAAMKFKRHLLLERKVMTNLDSILKSRDITLPTKVRLVKAMVFPETGTKTIPKKNKKQNGCEKKRSKKTRRKGKI